jgi:hypothetical protein
MDSFTYPALIFSHTHGKYSLVVFSAVDLSTETEYNSSLTTGKGGGYKTSPIDRSLQLGGRIIISFLVMIYL